MQRRVKTASDGAAGFRRLVCLLVLLTFSVQGFLVQTHIHGLPHSAIAAATEQTVAPPDDGKAPAGHDNCLLCQEFVHAGTFLMPAAAAVLPPAAAVSLVQLHAVSLVTARTVSHIWISRAPPRA